MKVLLATTCHPDDRKTVSAVRSLARAGATVVVGSDRFHGEAYASRHVAALLRYPHPLDGVEPFLDALVDHLERERFDALLPLVDSTNLAVAGHAAALAPLVGLALPEADRLAVAQDKPATLALARELDVPTPRTWLPEDAETLRACAAEVGYPCVVKLRRGAGAVGLGFARSPGELRRLWLAERPLDDLVFQHSRPMVQELVPGEVHDVCALFRRGEPRAALTQRRIRTYPACGGVGVLNETTDEPELRELAFRLLRALRWHGPAQVEFLVGAADGRPRLMEINGRFWGTLDLAARAGVDFATLAARLARDGDVDPVLDHRVGLRYRWPFPYALLLGRQGVSPWTILRELCLPSIGSRSDVSLADPLPHLAEMLYIVRRVRDRRRHPRRWG